ncbi:MAG TPA: acyl-CoA thioesterase [Myxococcaceae bacterium]|nr:acyl-CoA thioesterase [Myxococcaceae bacterium]
MSSPPPRSTRAPLLAAKSAEESEAVMTQLILPTDANVLNAAFGGKVMEWIDICGAVAAQRHCRQVVVTASMDDLHFHAPIRVGWIVTLRARVLAAFNTSMEVGVVVTAEDPFTGAQRIATSALLTFVALGPDGSKTAVPPLALTTAADRHSYAAAQARRSERMERSKRDEAAPWRRVFEATPKTSGRSRKRTSRSGSRT